MLRHYLRGLASTSRASISSGNAVTRSRQRTRHSRPMLVRPRSGESRRSRALEDVVVPVKIAISNNDQATNLGEELAGRLDKRSVGIVLTAFAAKPNIRTAAMEQGLNDKLFHKAFVEFRIFAQESRPLPPELHVKLADILAHKAMVEDLLPFFMEHARLVFPHLECLADLKSISDLTQPHAWYPTARSMQRKIFFHAGPTNSGKTHHALERFNAAKTGVYCGPLKLLASEVFYKTNALGVPCDMKTGDDRKYASGSKESPANHMACTVEMLDTEAHFEVAVIDEIQMARDMQRGWAWTRALLGVCAEEVHLCGEPAVLELLREMLLPIGEEVEVKRYKRMSPLSILDSAVGSFENIADGDAVVCFNKRDIFNVSRKLEALGRQVAVIYGSLPPATKLAQAARFNDPNDPCKVLIATDAVGMGLNLHINRVVFYSLLKPQLISGNQGNMETQIEPLPVHEAKQIGGRAGRFGTAYEEGQVTTFRAEDIKLLRQIWESPVEEVEAAGLRPTLEQIEMFSFHLPQATLSNLLHIFMSLVSLNDSSYFMCQMEDTLFLASLIEHVPLPLRTRYTFCLAPVTNKQPKICSIYLKFARRLSRSEPCTFSWFASDIGWPIKPPETLADLMELETVFDIMELYLWFSYRFEEAFPDPGSVREIQSELDAIIQNGVTNIVALMKRTETLRSSGVGKEVERSSSEGGSSQLRSSSLDVAELLTPSEIEVRLKEELRRKEQNLVLELVQEALRESPTAQSLDIREMASLLESLASDLDSPEAWAPETRRGRSRMPTSPTLRKCLKKRLLSQNQISKMNNTFKTKRDALAKEFAVALNAAERAAR